VKVPQSSAPASISVTSPAFGDGQTIPERYTCRGAGQSPPLRWSGVPAGSSSVALVVTDPDAPRGTFVHWVLYDLPGEDGELSAGQVPAGAQQGENSAGKSGWYPPCPPSGTHHYVFTVYALDGLPGPSSGQGLLDAIVKATGAVGTLTGTVAAG
jgi:Raf kinase inhibitor-like YbhB/YbcL family protein